MAIYHLSAKVVSRAKGQSVVASAAYRASEALHDDRYGLTHDYTRKEGVEHSEILLPQGAPEWMTDRQTLWNAVESAEKRKDSQLARELEIGLPIELNHAENVELVRDYLKTHFVSKGMVADFSIHEDDPNNPHAHVLLTMREVSEEGFGKKVRSWNAKADLLKWRESWAEKANEHLAQASHAIRIDHRTLEAQNIELEPGRKIGIGQERQAEGKLPRHIAERIKDSERIAHENGELILADPTIALRSITHQCSTFTMRDIAKFLHTRTQGAEQFQAAFLKVTTSNELVALGKDDRNIVRFTTRAILEAEKSLLSRSRAMDIRKAHGVAARRQESALSQSNLSEQQREAFVHVVGEGDLKALVGVAGSGKSTMLAAARQAWEAEGLTVKGAALSGIAAENLQIASGINSRTLASYEWNWGEGRDPLTRNDVLVIDEAGMVGTKQLERMLAAADKHQAKVVLVGDPEQLQAIEAGAAFRGIVGQTGMVELTQVRRQKQAWAREATQALSAGKTAEALAAYEKRGWVLAADTHEEARRKLLEAWSQDAEAHPIESRLILAYTRDDVRELNTQAREIRKSNHELGRSESIKTTRGTREIAANDRIMFLRNEKSLGIKNGTLGTVEKIHRGVLQIRLDGKDETRVVVDTRDYQDLDLGYASTVHKSQGSTVDRSYVLASRYFDRHSSYVALSRHRESATVFYGREEFVAPAGQGSELVAVEARRNFEQTLARARPKDLAHDYLDPTSLELTVGIEVQALEAEASPSEEKIDHSPEALQRRGREAWAALRAKEGAAQSPEAIQQDARERWLKYRSEQEAGIKGKSAENAKDHGLDDDQSL